MGLSFIILLIYFCVISLFYPRIQTAGRKDTPTLSLSTPTFPWMAFFLILLFRLILALTTRAFPADMGCWSAWGDRLMEVGPSAFYSADYFCDYPPTYLYVLGFLAKINSFLPQNEMIQHFILRLPALVCDLLLFVFLLQFGEKQTSKKNAEYTALLFALSPIFWLDSAVWGQIESVLLLFLLLAFGAILNNRFSLSMVFYVLAILIKPQALLLGPIFLLALLETKSLSTFLKAALSALGVFYLVIIPFAPAWQNDSGLSMLLHTLDPVWIIEKYLATLSSYQYFTVNAFNLYGLLGLNWVSLNQGNLSSFLSVLNYVIIGLGVLGCIYLYYKIEEKPSKLFLSSYFILGFLYTFAFKMHERYILLPILFLLLEYLYHGNKKILGVFLGLSSVGFLNLFYILQLALTTGAMPSYALVTPLSFLEVCLFLYSIYVIYKEYLCSSPTTKSSSAQEAILTLFHRPNMKRILEIVQGCDEKGKQPKKQKKMLRLDYILLSTLMLVYSITAFWNLGDMQAPQTYYKPESVGEQYLLTLAEPTKFTEISYYCGIGDTSKNPGLKVSVSTDGLTWGDFPESQCKLTNVFCWKTQLFEPMTIQFIRFRAESTDYTLYELSLRDIDGNPLNIQHIAGINADNFRAALDEQHLVTNRPSYKNSTYFDEIYHPRTAYEHLHMLPYYETTHPPLGKLIMSVGIAIFGMTPFGWRCMGTLMGILMLPFFYLLLKRFFGRTRYAFFGTFLFAFDFMHFSLTRIATIDSYPVFFILGMYYFMYRFGEVSLSYAKGNTTSYKPLLKYLFFSGLCMGLGCASKWTAVYASVGLGVVWLVIMIRTMGQYHPVGKESSSRFILKTSLWCCLFFLLIPAIIYTMSYYPISMVEGYGNVFQAMWKNQSYMLNYHSTLNSTHPYSSPWYSWPVVYRPMWAYQADSVSVNADQIGCISIFQNPLLSWVGIVAFFYSLVIGWKRRDRRVLFLTIGLLAQYLPWALISRYALQYHFFATLPFLICFVIYAMRDLEGRYKKFGRYSTVFVAVCFILFLMFYPVISGVPVSRFWVETFLDWFDPWVFFI